MPQALPETRSPRTNPGPARIARDRELSARTPIGLRLAHAAWIATAVVALVMLGASAEGYAVWLNGQSGATPGADPVSGWYVLSGIVSLAGSLVSLSLGLLLFLRKRQDRMALFVSFYVLAYGVIMSGPLENLDPIFPGASELAIGWVQPVLLLTPTIMLIILLPDGRLVPRWTRWVGLASVATLGFLPFVGADAMSAFDTPMVQLMGAVWLALYGLAFGAQIYRYRRVSTPRQRVQTRWIVFGLVIWMTLLIVQAGPYVYLGNLPPGAPLPSWVGASAALWWLAVSIIPITLSVSILRHRLYDIDLIINRALVYGALTAILAGMYSASISLFQKVFIALTGEKSDAAIVVTTLLLAATFTPIKTRLQAAVDRRFRDGHDPLRRLAEFARRVEGGVWVVDPRLALVRLLDEAMAAFDPLGGEVTWMERGSERVLAARGQWTGDVRLTLPLVRRGVPEARLSLGPRRSGAAYETDDARALDGAMESIAQAWNAPPVRL